MKAAIKDVSRDYAGYILKVTTYDESEDAEHTTRHDFATADELEAYAAAHGLVADTYDYQIHEWSDGTWLEVHTTVDDEF
jgi:hypothetical protein